VAILALAILLGATDWLPAAEAHLFADTMGNAAVSPSAIHPGELLHVEMTTVAKRPWSPVRLHSVRAKEANLCAAVAVAPPVLRSLLPESPEVVAGGASDRPTGARAPPLA
jgi:hypothetical protein